MVPLLYFEGNYSLADVNENDVLMVTYIGYLTQEIKVGKQSVNKHCDER